MKVRELQKTLDVVDGERADAALVRVRVRDRVRVRVRVRANPNLTLTLTCSEILRSSIRPYSAATPTSSAALLSSSACNSKRAFG